ncbi:MAG TPA: hypothetical protein VJ302_31425 [Blastocatellia bacterium]|nr:hypothetical protein [Blastocatellia bacterium]
MTAAAPARGQEVPPAPAQDYDRFGAYLWTSTYYEYERLVYKCDCPETACLCQPETNHLRHRQLIDTLSAPGKNPARDVPLKDVVSSLGTRTIRVVIGNVYGGRYQYGLEPPHDADRTPKLSMLEWVAGRPAGTVTEYEQLFADPHFKTYILGYNFGRVFDRATRRDGGLVHTPPPDYEAEKREIRELTEYLLGQENGVYRFPGKRFIFLNWELDSQLEYYINDPRYTANLKFNPEDPVYRSFWDELVKVIRALSSGVREEADRANRLHPDDPNRPQVHFGVEFSKIYRFKNPAEGDFTMVGPCGQGNRLGTRCAVSYLPTRLNAADPAPAPIDYWSYSSYNTSNEIMYHPGLNLRQKVRQDLTMVLDRLNAGRPPASRYQPKHLIIGELGYSNNTYRKEPRGAMLGESYSMGYLREAYQAYKAFGVAFVIYFQTTDAMDPGNFSNVSDFSLLTGKRAFLDYEMVLTGAGEAYTRSSTSEVVWVDDEIPALKRTYPPGNWHELTPRTSVRPVSGKTAFQTELHPNPAREGFAYFFCGAGQPLIVDRGETLFAYLWLDPEHPPKEIMLQWSDGTSDHRAYWGDDVIDLGTDGTASRRRIGALPPAGSWVRLEVPANIVGLEGRRVDGFSLIVSDGRAAFDRLGKLANESVWIDDDLAGGRPGTETQCDCPQYPWLEVSGAPLPISGTRAFQTGIADGRIHTQYVEETIKLQVNAGEDLFAYVYLDPDHPPETVMLQFKAGGGPRDWAHRAYWGRPLINWSPDGSAGNYYMGPLPPLGQWVRLEVPADRIGLAGHRLNGFGVAAFSGRVAWDRVGKTTRDLVWLDEEDDLPRDRRFQEGGDLWTVKTRNAISGAHAFQTAALGGLHQIYASGLDRKLTIYPGDTLFAYVYLEDPDPQNARGQRLRELMLQWHEAGGSWDHRAFWGENLIFSQWGLALDQVMGPIDDKLEDLLTNARPLCKTNRACLDPLTPVNYRPGTDRLRFMGSLPVTGSWVRLEIPASRVFSNLGPDGITLDGFALTLFGGRGTVDRIGKVRNEHLDY